MKNYQALIIQISYFEQDDVFMRSSVDESDDATMSDGANWNQ